ncbi:MAG: 2,3,4,5-tetrahydropyridine-2,6-dicarboxylate N-succinyltransferase [Bdellovibrionales bacterium]|nr:2,3,4,5-tetrahydropyridine-2,6-dicarboxylate N-succinyltransferase [Bdellovibrionales bacterium]
MSEFSNLKQVIKEVFESKQVEKAGSEIETTISLLDQGKIRVCEKKEDTWQVNEWVKKSILLYFQLKKSTVISIGEDFSYFDKIPLKQWTGNEGVRVVPQALVRQGSYVASNTVLMPSYINIGAYVDSGSLIDTWATVGSCAQVGKNVHVSGGVGLGGVLEPLQAQPVIIEDNVFIGSRCIIVEGVQVKKGAVLGAGVVITKSSKIIDVTSKEEKVFTGIVPENSVVIPGTRKKQFPSGEYSIPCSLIIGKRSSSTDLKTSLNSVLRDIPV